ncbi:MULTISPECIES: hypothetical protein [Halobacteriovorax]|uniref:Uncharacterized protein n=1 Tax=Halobacteriovorax vibrionivorans TaxID=2152716 RepID=A0ABY0IIS8_9BACT|nr:MULTISPECIES: hypothetical protein [Halobacteriovorax]RZF21766.1 hypothetical protein DAY19_08740 [Halobacteriovorax vibrionivorans]TGD45855.1 hypothetical protein EP118_14270 [Halobacteriovorax sp. Y22]
MFIFKYLQLFLLILILHPTSALSLVQEDGVKGEWDFEHYDGPLDPRLIIDHQNEKQEFYDEYTGRNYFDVLLVPELTDLSQDFNRYIYPNFSCSKYELKENLAYMRYLIRLTSIASLYEFYRQTSIALYQYGDEKSCQIDYETIFKQCKPKSKDMKLFIGRVSDFFPDIVDWGKYPIKLKTDRRFSLETYHPDLVKILRLDFGGDEKSHLIKACQFAKNEIQSLCSENDEYMAAAQIKEIRNEILKSSAFKILNRSGKGQACFTRYEEMAKDMEEIDDKSKRIIKTALTSKGELKVFWFGALKEFDDQGITLVEQKKPEPVKKVKKVEEKKPEPVKTVDIKSIKIIRKPKPQPKKPEPKPVEKVSAFEKALRNFEKSKEKTVVDMTSFKTDYKFSKKTLEKFNGSLRSFQTRKQLSKMKRVDNLGSVAAPMSLTFIKYLIDYNLHQGLYNMTGILSNDFYVINDLENKSRPVKIKLDNNKDTGFKWKIWVTDLE